VTPESQWSRPASAHLNLPQPRLIICQIPKSKRRRHQVKRSIRERQTQRVRLKKRPGAEPFASATAFALARTSMLCEKSAPIILALALRPSENARSPVPQQRSSTCASALSSIGRNSRAARARHRLSICPESKVQQVVARRIRVNISRTFRERLLAGRPSG